jgi:DNA-binding CsgD family transcriptional regulator
MVLQVTPRDLQKLAPSGHYIALRIGFAFPMEEVNELPRNWVDHYTKNRMMIYDPTMRWAYANTGTARWSEFAENDPHGVLRNAAVFGLRFGLTVGVFDDKPSTCGQRSFASFARPDREFSDLEVKLLETYVKRRHYEMVPPTNLTLAELQTLAMFKDGLRLKEIAFKLSITEGAVKQRLKNAKNKLGASTSTQAATMARQFKLI